MGFAKRQRLRGLVAHDQQREECLRASWLRFVSQIQRIYADLFNLRGEKENLSMVLDEVEALRAVEWEASVARYERQLLGDGMGDDDMIRGILVALCLIDLHLGISAHMLPFDWQNFDIVFLLYGINHSLL